LNDLVSEEIRILFATDIHGSNACFRKALSAFAGEDRPNVVIIGGDITGKGYLPIVKLNDSNYELTDEEGQKLPIRDDELEEVLGALADKGLYGYVCDINEARRLRINPKKRNKVLADLQKDRVREWVKAADQYLSGSDRLLVMNTGNDDPFFIDPLLDHAQHVLRPEAKLLRLGEHLTMISCGFTTPTPWHTPREKSEEELEELIARYAESVPDLSRCILNFHCPPRDTKLDLAPKLDPTSLRRLATPLGGQWEHVGSHSVRKAIEELGPAAGLHGHIHEQHAWHTLGATWCCNPGSQYHKGLLQSAFLVFRNGERVWEELKRDDKPIASNTWTTVLTEGVKGIPFVGGLLSGILKATTPDSHSKRDAQNIQGSASIQTRLEIMEARPLGLADNTESIDEEDLSVDDKSRQPPVGSPMHPKG
jgi:Icc-related predicted phosphoesterase